MAANPIVNNIRIIPRDATFLNRTVGNSGDLFIDRDNNTIRLYSGKERGGYELVTQDNLSKGLSLEEIATVTYTVTVGAAQQGETGNKYYLNGSYKPSLSLMVGYIYVFDQTDSTNLYYPNQPGTNLNKHPLNFEYLGEEYKMDVIYFLDDSVVTSEKYKTNFERAETRKIAITIKQSMPNLDYVCFYHTDMGNSITSALPNTSSGGGTPSEGASLEVSSVAPQSPSEGSLWLNEDNGKLYVYVEDTDSGQWIQPAVPTYSSILDLGITDGTDGQVLTTDGAGNFSFTTVQGGGGGVDLTAFSVGAEATPSGDGAIGYDNTTGVFTYTPPAFTLDDVISNNGTTASAITVGALTSNTTVTYANEQVEMGVVEITVTDTETIDALVWSAAEYKLAKLLVVIINEDNHVQTAEVLVQSKNVVSSPTFHNASCDHVVFGELATDATFVSFGSTTASTINSAIYNAKFQITGLLAGEKTVRIQYTLIK